MNGKPGGTHQDGGAQLQRDSGQPRGYDISTAGASGFRLPLGVSLVRYDSGAASILSCCGHAGDQQPTDVHLLREIEYKLFEISVHDLGRAIQWRRNSGRSSWRRAITVLRSIESCGHKWTFAIQQHRAGKPARGFPDDRSAGLPKNNRRTNIFKGRIGEYNDGLH